MKEVVPLPTLDCMMSTAKFNVTEENVRVHFSARDKPSGSVHHGNSETRQERQPGTSHPHRSNIGSVYL